MPVNPEFHRSILRDIWTCPSCGSKNLSNEEQCPECGAKKPEKEIVLRAWRDRDGRVY